LSAQNKQLRLLLDAGVPDSIGDVFKSHGYHVILHRDVLGEKVPDEVVCAIALRNDAAFVAIDGDVNRLAKRYGVTPKGDRFADLSVIHLCCNEVLAPKRLEQCMSLIKHEWEFTIAHPKRRMWIDIHATGSDPIGRGYLSQGDISLTLSDCRANLRMLTD
jgi:predicted nuclease of predicted toxin-antitoxin system